MQAVRAEKLLHDLLAAAIFDEVDHLRRVRPGADRIGDEAKGGVLAGPIGAVADLAVENAGRDRIERLVILDHRADRQKLDLNLAAGALLDEIGPGLLIFEVRIAGRIGRLEAERIVLGAGEAGHGENRDGGDARADELMFHEVPPDGCVVALDMERLAMRRSQ